MLLGSLPERFESFTVIIESRDEIPNVANLKIKLFEEKAQQKKQTERDGCFDKEKKSDTNSEALYTKTTKQLNLRVNKNKNALKPQPKFNGKCYEYGKMRPKRRLLRKEKTQSQENK